MAGRTGGWKRYAVGTEKGKGTISTSYFMKYSQYQNFKNMMKKKRATRDQILIGAITVLIWAFEEHTISNCGLKM